MGISAKNLLLFIHGKMGIVWNENISEHVTRWEAQIQSLEKICLKKGYGHEINSNHLLESFRRADHVPIPPGHKCYHDVAVDRTTPPEPGDTADWSWRAGWPAKSIRKTYCIPWWVTMDWVVFPYRFSWSTHPSTSISCISGLRRSWLINRSIKFIAGRYLDMIPHV